MKTPPDSSDLAARSFTVRRGDGQVLDDLLAVEEPLEIRLLARRRKGLEETPVSITMRTPGHDFELALGFLYGEGLLKDLQDLGSNRPALPERPGCNTVRVILSESVRFDPDSLKRNFYATSSCGVCGKASLEALRQIAGPRPPAGLPQVSAQVIASLPERLGRQQPVFRRTGGLHAAALFDQDGGLESVREDVGRHNAVDKVVGRSLLDGRLPLHRSLLMVSGRTSFEILQKAQAAGIPLVASVSAPSSLAVETAREFGITLLGFVRQGQFNIYCGPERVDHPIKEPIKTRLGRRLP